MRFTLLFKKSTPTAARCTLAAALLAATPPLHAQPHGVVLLIGDGMGPGQIEAAGIYKSGEPGSLFFEQFPTQGRVTTRSANSTITDSAAAATAMATGRKVRNGALSIAVPGDNSPLPTLLELSQKEGKRCGLVTTAWLTHATPAAFGAHESARASYADIGRDYLHDSKPHLLLGGGANGLPVPQVKAAGYTVVTDKAALAALDPAADVPVAGLFGDSHLPYVLDGLGELPSLAAMTRFALRALESDEDGFFLMVEGARIDHACHDNKLERCIGETLAFDEAVQEAMSWAKGRKDILVIVTADHETGGLTVTENNGKGVYPKVTWATKGHSAADVSVSAWGPGAESFQGTMDNTDLFSKIRNAPATPPAQSPAPASPATR